MTDDCQKFKLIFLGDQYVGKSSILFRFAQDKFEQDYQPTIGLDFHSKNVTINGANVRLLLYDTAGQEKFKSLIPMYIRDANVIIVVYDITVKNSFTNTSHWVNETKDLKREDAIFCLVGNKIDLENERTVTTQEAQQFADENGFLFFEVSAKTGQGIQELFTNNIYNEMAKKFRISGDDDDTPQQGGQDNNNQGTGTVKIGENQEDMPRHKKGGCCGSSSKKKSVQNQQE